MKNFISQIAKKAGKEILKHFKRDKVVKIKSKSQIVTQADLISNKIIIEAIRKKYPNHQILTEESGTIGKKNDYLWIIDPLDGTTNYSFGNPLFAVSIGVVKNNDIIFGAVYAPLLNEFYFAEKNKGAYLNNKNIKVSKESEIKSSILSYCHGSSTKDVKKAVEFYRKLKLKSRDIRQLGSASLELGFVASGRIESIIIPGAHLWDVAAGILLVREAGGQVTDFFNYEWNLKSPDMAATNGKIHNILIKYL